MILDTTLLVDLLRGDPEAMTFAARMEKAGQILWVPTPALFELWEGVERSDRADPETQKLQRLAAAYTVLAFEPRHAAAAGRLSGAAIRKGEMLDPVDAQIAGMALEERLPVVTRKQRHFERVPGLVVVPY